jgi:murein DD-endopeptidase MepM/ murein hydrolase activator NlpD
MTRRRLGLSFLALAATTLAALTVAAAVRDKTPPQLYFEAPLRVAAATSVEVFVSADEPVTYLLSYAGDEFQEVAQDFRFALVAAPGDNIITITATDAAGNATVVSAPLLGVPAITLDLDALTTVRSADPLGITLRWDDTGAAIESYSIVLGGVDQHVGSIEGVGVYAVAATPMTVDPLELELVATLIDEFHRTVEARQTVTLEPLPFVVEQLQLSAQTLSVITPEGRDLEAATLAAAWGQAAPEALWSEPFIMPIEGRHTSGFADARRYVAGGPVSYHNGLDLAAPLGTPVQATNDGRVLVAGMYPIKGGWVLVDHGFGVTSLYFHLSKIDVEVGQRVQRGALIGEVGSTGLSTGPHLHWEMRVGERPSNPLVWVDKVRP